MSFLKEVSDKLKTDGNIDLPRREHTFEMDVDRCRPGVFPRNFTVTLQELSVRQEMDAAKNASGDAIRYGYEMARASVMKVDGDIIGESRTFFWEAIGSRGRSRVIEAYTNHIVSNEGKD